MNELAQYVAHRVQSGIWRELPRRAALVILVSIALACGTIVARMSESQEIRTVIERCLQIVKDFVPWFLHLS